MADFDDDIPDNRGGKNPLVKVGGIVVVIAVIAALAVAGTLYFLDKDKSKPAPVDGEQTQDTDIVAQSSGSIESSDTLYYIFEDDFIAPLNGSGIETKRQRYLKVGLAVASSSSKSLSLVASNLPRVISEIEQTLRDQDFSTLQTREGKLQLQLALSELVDSIIMNESGGSEHIDRVLITDFVMQ